MNQVYRPLYDRLEGRHVLIRPCLGKRRSPLTDLKPHAEAGRKLRKSREKGIYRSIRLLMK